MRTIQRGISFWGIRRIGVVVIAGALSLAATVQAGADVGEPAELGLDRDVAGASVSEQDELGVDYTPSSERGPNSPEAEADIAHELLTLRQVPTLPRSDLEAIDAELMELASRNADVAALIPERTATAATRNGDAISLGTPIAPARRHLGVTHQAQATQYYCGPATASMIVKYKGKNYSQKTLAGEKYLQTDKDKATRWVKKRMAPTLNKIVGTSEYQTHQSPTMASFKASFLHDIGRLRLPIAVDTFEFANGAHYNHHTKGRSIGHWIVGDGYSDYANHIFFTDPASPTVFKDAAKTFGASAEWFHKFVTTNGIVS